MDSSRQISQYDKLFKENKVIDKLQSQDLPSLALEKYYQQLRIFATLRNLQTLIKEIMESISKYLKIENDPLYLKGEEKGQQAKTYQFVVSLLTKMNLSTEQIAELAGVTSEFVEKVRQEL
jgi:septum formation topological specificity factor MinE